MFSWFAWLSIFAADEPQQPQSPFGALMVPMILIFIVWYFLMLRPQRAEQKKREELLNALKKNDRVVTIGGIIGTIANVSPDGKEVTVKVDDNVKIKFQRTAIHAVQRDDEPADAAKLASDKPA